MKQTSASCSCETALLQRHCPGDLPAYLSDLQCRKFPADNIGLYQRYQNPRRQHKALSLEKYLLSDLSILTHWGRATHICVNKLTTMASNNGLSPGRHQAIIWNNAGILSFGLLGTNFTENLIEILTFSFKKMRSKVSSAKWRPFCLGLNVLTCSNRFGRWLGSDDAQSAAKF